MKIVDAMYLAERNCRSKCCNAEVRADGLPDFLGSREVCTVSFVCTKCSQDCCIVRSRSRRQKARVSEVPEMIELNVNDDIEIRLTKEGRKIYEAYRKKYRYEPIKKIRGSWLRIQLFEFMYIFGPRMFMEADAVIVGNLIRIPKS